MVVITEIQSRLGVQGEEDGIEGSLEGLMGGGRGFCNIIESVVGGVVRIDGACIHYF